MGLNRRDWLRMAIAAGLAGEMAETHPAPRLGPAAFTIGHHRTEDHADRTARPADPGGQWLSWPVLSAQRRRVENRRRHCRDRRNTRRSRCDQGAGSGKPVGRWPERLRAIASLPAGAPGEKHGVHTRRSSMACLDACGRATGRRLCELLGGPVRDPVEFAAYLFYRYAADHPVILADPRLVDSAARGDRALDHWGEVRTPEAMAAMAAKFRDRGASGCSS